MLFNDYAFLLVFLPAASSIYRFADPHPAWRIGVLVMLSFVFYSYWNPPFIILLILSITINWLAARAYLATKRAGFITGAIVANLAVLRFVQIRQFRLRKSDLPVRAAALAFQHRAAARDLVLYLPSHHVSGGSATRKGAGVFAWALRAVHLVLSAGDCRTAGALVGGHAPVRQAGVHAGLATAVRYRRDLHRDRPDRKDVACRSTRTPA